MNLDISFSRYARHTVKALCVSCICFGGASVAQEATIGEGTVNPYASNNGMFPTLEEYDRGYFNASNLDYPKEKPPSFWPAEGLVGGELTQTNAAEYMAKLKDLIEPDMRTLVENHEAWNAKAAGWYNMVWRGPGTPGQADAAINGREVIMNTNTGQIVPNISWKTEYRPIPEWVQNFGVIYYNDVAAYTLGQVFEDVYNPDPSKMDFADGSIVVKIEATTVPLDKWPWKQIGEEESAGGSVLNGAPSWTVYRPSTENQKDFRDKDKRTPLVNEVQSVHPFQLAIKVKDSKAAPDTGWVYLGFVYDARSKGASPWDRFTPAGLMWGNDPEYASTPDGRPPEGEELKETWVNPDAPPFIEDTIGWGGRFAAPKDVAVRHNVEYPVGLGDAPDDPPGDGVRVSACLSCHGAAQYPLMNNIYPSPDHKFPQLDASEEPFHLYWPGSEQWARWYKNRPGSEPLYDPSKDRGDDNIERVFGLDYDLSSSIALMICCAPKSETLDFEGLLLGIMNGH